MTGKKEIRKIMDRIIGKRFPVLRGKSISLYGFTIFGYSGAANWFLPFWRAIFINSKLKCSKIELEALIAHELCHLEAYEKRGWIKSILLQIFYLVVPKQRKKIEEEVEKLVISKGYARGAYKRAKKILVHKPKSIQRYYMSAEEIKSYAERIGKW